ncbi:MULTISPECIES: aldo/keto reductase [Sorangium]|uniref:Aldo/keto reductase n=1 Tax=Sorangium cellulosum TaxID=56 RepID=A0A4P2QHW0_SORCE|nr:MULTISPECIES: aldo/keto reductase [Sorangium]AUX29141.1 aldo/keto reductase [Sorangium cellulosum]WCQ88534.1 Aldo-keto reductase YhdN [Sorangium sp. Soce836]
MELTNIREIQIPASRVGLGTWAMGGVQWGGADDDASVRTIHAALDLGINLIDTAPAYGFGHSEEVVGRAIAERGQRERVVLATKVGLERRGDALFRNGTRKQILEEVELSLMRLRTDYIDLYQVHWPDPQTPYEETAQAILDLQREGKIRAIGVSNYSIDAMQRFRSVAPLSSAQPPLNLFERQAEGDILPWCRDNGIATLTYGALCRGLLSGAIDEKTAFKGDDLRRTDPKFQPPRFTQYLDAVRGLDRFARDRYARGVLALAVRWVLDHPGVSVALWGARRPEELAPINDVMGWSLDDEARAHIDAVLTGAVRDPVGPEFMAPPERPAEARSAA